jgi:hypothetical protein
MSPKPYKAAKVSEIPTPPSEGITESAWKPVRHHLGIRAFGVNAFVARKAGELMVEEHDENPEPGSGVQGHEELYFVSSGWATFTIAGETLEAPAGTLVFVHPEATRAVVAGEPGTTLLAIGAPLGEVFRISDWETRRLEPTAR